MEKRRLEILRGISLIVLVSLMLVTFTSTAQATWHLCRTDPIVFLSNGDKVTITSTIYTNEELILEVRYDLHVPPGVTATKIIYTAGGLDGREIVYLYDDNPANTYTSATLVSITGDPVQVDVNMKLKGNNRTSATGVTGETIYTTLTH